MPDYAYRRLTAGDRKNTLDGRILELERQHFERRLDLIQADGDNVNVVSGNLAALEEDLIGLGEEADAIEAELTQTDDTEAPPA